MTRPPEVRAGVEDADLSGTTALVTGSTSGIGRETALSLGRLGADVFVHGRDTEAGADVVEELTESGAEAQFIQADYTDVEAVKDLAATVAEECDQLDLLLNNAGGLFQEGKLTDIGVEYTFHINHLAPYLLTAELLERDHLAEGGRVVTTASIAHRGISFDMDEVTSVKGFSGVRAYQRSKLANVQFALALADRLDAAGSDITSNALHPGAIPGSEFSRFLPNPMPQAMGTLSGLPFVTSVTGGAGGLVRLAVSEEVEGVTGQYFAKHKQKRPSREARDTEAQRELWEGSAELLDIEPPLSDVLAEPEH